MHAVRIRSTGWIAALAFGLSLGGCSLDNWEWPDWTRTEKKERPVTKADRPAHRPKTAQARSRQADQPEDKKARQVDERVERYVRNMTSHYDPTYQNNDFNAKIRRQRDPNRRSRILRAVAADSEPSNSLESQTSGGITIQPASLRETHVEPQADKQTEPPREPRTGLGTETPNDIHTPSLNRPQERGNTETLRENQTPRRAPLADRGRTDKAPDSGTRPEVASAQADREEVTGGARPESNAETSSRPGSAPAESESADHPMRPPVLGQIKVSAGPEPAEPAGRRPTDEARPAANVAKPATEPQDTFKRRLEEQEARVAQDPNNLEEQFRLRMMYLVNGQDDKALAPTDGIDEELQVIMEAHIRALMAARSSAGRDAATWANRQLEAIEALRNVVRARADLQVPEVVICSSIDGFGRYEAIEPAEFPAGQKNKVLLYIGVDNYRSTRTASGLYRTLLSVRLSLLNRAGEELWSARTDNIEDLSRQRRRDFFLSYGPIAIPKALGPGEYVLKVEVEDILAGKINSNAATFKLVLP